MNKDGGTLIDIRLKLARAHGRRLVQSRDELGHTEVPTI